VDRAGGLEWLKNTKCHGVLFSLCSAFFSMPYLGWYFGGFEGGAIGSMLSMFVIYGLVSGAFEGKPSELKTGSATNNRYHL